MTTEEKFLCTKCKITKDKKDFPKHKTKKNGVDSWCKDCRNENLKQHRKDNEEKYRDSQKKRMRVRIEWIQNLKNFPCMDCGIKYESFCMDYDHRGDKIKSISRMVLEGWPREKILEEIKKCDLVCILCHNTRTKKRLDEKHPTKKYSEYFLKNMKIINEAKEAPCYICGIQYENHNMQFNHSDPSKKYKNICQLKSANTEVLLKEIEKCQVICALCHRRKSILEQQAGIYLIDRNESMNKPEITLPKVRTRKITSKKIEEISKIYPTYPADKDTLIKIPITEVLKIKFSFNDVST